MVCVSARPECLNVLPPGVNKGIGAAFLGEQAGIPVEDMLAVGDSDVDLPLLSRVGHPVAVDPDATLRAHAEQQGWPVISLR